MKSPFDLHVLGTPPAFILSQDQTLMLKWCLCPASFIWHCLLLIRVACQSFDQLACSWISLKILEFSGLHYCLFVKDHNLLLRKSLFVCCCYSQRQLWYLIITAFVCQQLFWNLFRLGKLCFPWQIFMLTYLSDFVNNFFWNLFKFLSSCCVVSALPQQRIWVYHPVPHLSTLFCIFFKQFCKSSKKAHNHGLFCHFGSYCLFSFSHNLQYICL